MSYPDLSERLLQINKQIDEAVNENFGYTPDNALFDLLLNERNQIEDKLKDKDTKE